MANTNTSATHAELIYGATGSIPLLYPKSNGTEPQLYTKVILEFITRLAASGYVITNPELLFEYDNLINSAIRSTITKTIESAIKQSFILRKSFGTSVKLEDYTVEDWEAIFAQYSLTYGWSDQYQSLLGKNPATVLSEYIGDAFDKTIELPSKVKYITLLDRAAYEEYILSILESKIPLRLHQEQIVQTIDFSDLNTREPVYSIKSTKALVQSTVYKQGGEPLISNLDEMQRFILNNCQKGDNGEDYNGQILNSMLKSFKFHIPTRMKKFILNWFNNQMGKYLVEQMYSNEQWWKRMFHHCNWCSASKFNTRYSNVRVGLDLLYNTDRSWTFNSRYQSALKANDYANAITILAERPGLLLRNLVMFCKYTIGTDLPVKASSSSSSNPLTKALSGAQVVQTVQTDASEWINTQFESFLIRTKPALKIAWQLIETLLSPEHQSPISTRNVQGQIIEYSTPIPAVNPELVDTVVTALLAYIKQSKIIDNQSLGRVYLAPELGNIAIQYSGANSNDISMSGTFLSPGTTLPLPEGDIIRMGVVWKNTGKGSCDIDLSTNIRAEDGDHICYYGKPVYKVYDHVIATSSGDITTCGTDTYSAEFIDIDLALAQRYGVQTVLNSLILFNGRGSLADYDTHLFLSVIERSKRITGGRNVVIDLAKQDYAVKLTDTVSSYLGFFLDIEQMTMTSIAHGLHVDRGSNAAQLQSKFSSIITNKPPQISLATALQTTIDSSQIVDDIAHSEFSIGITDEYAINVLKEAERVQQFIF